MKAAETGMLLDKIEKLTEAQSLIMDSLKIRSGFDGLAPVSHVDISQCSHCSSFEHVELDCPVMTIQGPYSFRPNPTTYPGLSQMRRSTYPNQGYSSFHNVCHDLSKCTTIAPRSWFDYTAIVEFFRDSSQPSDGARLWESWPKISFHERLPMRIRRLSCVRITPAIPGHDSLLTQLRPSDGDRTHRKIPRVAR